MLLVDIFIAAIGKTFDFELDPDEPVGFLVNDIVCLLQEEYGTGHEKAITDKESGKKESKVNKKREDLSILPDTGMLPRLYSCDQERMLPVSESLAGCGIRNGFRLILC